MGWGEFLGKIANWFPKREEHRRNVYRDLKRKRQKLLKKPYSKDNYRAIARLDRRMRDLENKALNG